MPLSQRQGSIMLSVIAVGMYFCVAATLSLAKLQFAGQVQKVCNESSGAVPHLAHKVSVTCKFEILDKGHVAPDIIVSKAHLKGY